MYASLVHRNCDNVRPGEIWVGYKIKKCSLVKHAHNGAWGVFIRACVIYVAGCMEAHNALAGICWVG